MTDLPRVTYTNLREDFSGVHARLDAEIAAFERERLGQPHPPRIAGRAVNGGTPVLATSPIDDRLVLGRFQACDATVVAAAVEAARGAAPGWAAAGWRERVRVLRAVADTVEARKWLLGVATLFEVGKSRLEAMGEVEESIDMIRFYCDELEAHDGYERPMRRAFAHEATLDVLRPYGVFAVISPFNYPVALSVGMASGALLGGNTVVFKPSPASGLTASLLAQAFGDGGLPPGVLNLVTGPAATGEALVRAPGVDGFVFTGSHAVGSAILREAAAGRTMRPVIVEMGGKNPCYVGASASLDDAVEGVFRSAFGMQGQKCSALSKLYLHDDIADAFCDRLLARMAAVEIGDPRERTPFMGPLVDARAAARYDAAVAQVRADGRLLAGGGHRRGGVFDHGHYVEPALAAGLPPAHPLHRDELFVPLLAVQRFSSLEAAIADGNAVDFGLTAGLYTGDDAELERFLDTAQAGVLYANRASGATTGAWPGIQSFCGWKGSGAGGKGGLGGHYLPQFMREQSRTVIPPAR